MEPLSVLHYFEYIEAKKVISENSNAFINL